MNPRSRYDFVPLNIERLSQGMTIKVKYLTGQCYESSNNNRGSLSFSLFYMFVLKNNCVGRGAHKKKITFYTTRTIVA